MRLSLCLATIAVVAGCSESAAVRTELHSAILLEDGSTAVISLSRWSDTASGAALPPVRTALLVRRDLKSGETSVLHSAVLAGDRALETLHLEETRGEYVLLRTWAEKRDDVYGLLNVRTRELQTLAIADVLRSQGMESMTGIGLGGPSGWLAVVARMENQPRHGFDGVYHIFVRQPGGPFVYVGFGGDDLPVVRHDDDEIVVDGSSYYDLVYRVRDGHRRWSYHVDTPLKFPHHKAGRSDTRLEVQLDLARNREPYLSLQRGSDGAVVETRVEWDLAQWNP